MRATPRELYTTTKNRLAIGFCVYLKRKTAIVARQIAFLISSSWIRHIQLFIFSKHLRPNPAAHPTHKDRVFPRFILHNIEHNLPPIISGLIFDLPNQPIRLTSRKIESKIITGPMFLTFLRMRLRYNRCYQRCYAHFLNNSSTRNIFNYKENYTQGTCTKPIQADSCSVGRFLSVLLPYNEQKDQANAAWSSLPSILKTA